MKKLDAVLDSLEKWMIFIFMFVMFALIVMQVLFRHFLKIPLPWAEEMARYCMIWATFIGIGAGVKAKAHVGVEGLVNLFPEKPRRAVNAAAAVIAVILYAVLFVLAAYLTMSIAGTGQTSPAMRCPMWLAYLALPVGLFMSVIRGLQITAGLIREAKGQGSLRTEGGEM